MPRPCPDDVSAPSIWRAWARGLLTNLLNPKIGAFYVVVLHQFSPAGTSHSRSACCWRSAQRAVDGTTGVALIGFGVKLGLSAR